MRRHGEHVQVHQAGIEGKPLRPAVETNGCPTGLGEAELHPLASPTSVGDLNSRTGLEPRLTAQTAAGIECDMSSARLGRRQPVANSNQTGKVDLADNQIDIGVVRNHPAGLAVHSQGAAAVQGVLNPGRLQLGLDPGEQRQTSRPEQAGSPDRLGIVGRPTVAPHVKADRAGGSVLPLPAAGVVIVEPQRQQLAQTRCWCEDWARRIFRADLLGKKYEHKWATAVVCSQHFADHIALSIFIYLNPRPPRGAIPDPPYIRAMRPRNRPLGGRLVTDMPGVLVRLAITLRERLRNRLSSRARAASTESFSANSTRGSVIDVANRESVSKRSSSVNTAVGIATDEPAMGFSMSDCIMRSRSASASISRTFCLMLSSSGSSRSSVSSSPAAARPPPPPLASFEVFCCCCSSSNSLEFSSNRRSAMALMTVAAAQAGLPIALPTTTAASSDSEDEGDGGGTFSLLSETSGCGDWSIVARRPRNGRPPGQPAEPMRPNRRSQSAVSGRNSHS
uniref:THAP-type domain-containing protein n=1 Tax=Macrostomum lignano TaxID=282301 RepID=A0A1I8GIU9_9PLAT